MSVKIDFNQNNNGILSSGAKEEKDSYSTVRRLAAENSKYNKIFKG